MRLSLIPWAFICLTLGFAPAVYSQTIDKILKKYENNTPTPETILSDGRILISVSHDSDMFYYDVLHDGQIYRCITYASYGSGFVNCTLLNSK